MEDEDQLLELNVSYNEFDEEVNLNLENELLGVEDNTIHEENVTSVTTSAASKDIENSVVHTAAEARESAEIRSCKEAEKIEEKTHSINDLRERLSSRVPKDIELVNVQNSSGTTDALELMDTDNEPSGSKRRKTGIDSEITLEMEEVAGSDGEEKEKMDVETGTKRKRGGKKKRKRGRDADLRGPVDIGIKNLYRYLDLKTCKTWQELAREIVFRLNEPKKKLIYKVVEVIGVEESWDLFKETVKAQKSGGLWINNDTRRRSSGGVFLYLLKAREYATEEQIKEIFQEENNIAKEIKKKEQKRHENEIIDDLRKQIELRKSELLAVEIEKTAISL